MWRKTLVIASCVVLASPSAFAQTDAGDGLRPPITDSLRPPMRTAPASPDPTLPPSPINTPPASQPASQPPSSPGVVQFDPLSTSSDNASALEKIEEVEAEAKAAAGAIFVSPEKVYVKAPLLQALITLDSTMASPYDLDADKTLGINLKDVVDIAYRNNLAIKISETEVGAKKWQYISSLGNFLPSVAGEVSYQGINGDYVSPAGLVLPINTPAGYLNMNAGYQQYLFKGGGILHGAREAKFKYKASQYGLKGTVNEVLNEAIKRYYELALNDVLLQIRMKAVELSKGLVIVNEDMLHEGVNTQLDLLQAKQQLSSDRQQLISQQVERREAAVKLATALNLDSGQDLVLKNRLLAKTQLVDKRLKPGDLLKVAVESRPELKRHEQLRLAALEQIKVARAPLLPAVTTSGTVIGTGGKVTSLSSSGGSTPLATTGGGTGVAPVSGAGGLPLTSSGTSPQRNWTTRSLFVIGVDVQWTLGGLGLTQAAKVQSAKYEARREQLEFNQALNKVHQQVRDAYLTSLADENLIIETTDSVKYGEEALRVAELRFREGVGAYIDVLNAQRSYIGSLVDKARALIKYNESQADLLFAIGQLSASTATSKTPFK
jgi:outer membrane protein TolC